MQQKPFRLITIPVSHYCEKARWALTKLKLPYVEKAHMPPFYRFATNRVGGKSTPVLVTKDGVFTDSTDILQYLNKIVPDNAKLYPSDPELCRQVEELEDLFDKQLGPATRCWGYFYVIDNYKYIQSRWTPNVPFWEKALFPVVYPFMRQLVRQAYNVNAESSAQAYEQIHSIFEKVNELLADGRTYLVGDSLTAADITFAALAAPVISPPEHPIKSTSVQELSSEITSKISAFRETPAGAYVLRLYRDRNS
ncbi:MAG: glutathione S-transferase family protein [Hassallia sp.]